MTPPASSSFKVYGKPIQDREINRILEKVNTSRDPKIQGILKDCDIENWKEMDGLVNPNGTFSVDEEDLIALNKVLKPQNQLQARELGTLAVFLLSKRTENKGYVLVKLPEKDENAVKPAPSAPNAQPAQSTQQTPDLSVQPISPRKYKVTWTSKGSREGTFEIPEHVGKGRTFNSIEVVKNDYDGKSYLVINYSIKGNSQLLAARPSDDAVSWNSRVYTIDADGLIPSKTLYNDKNLQAMIDAILPKKGAAEPVVDLKGNSTQPTDLLSAAIARTLPAGNQAFSSYSVLEALSMLVGGLSEPAYQAVAKKLGLSPDLKSQLQQAQAVRQPLTRAPGIQLSVANNVYALPGTFTSEYESLIKTHFDVKSPGKVNFKTNPEAARKEINRWVSEQTKGLIPELLTSGDVDANTVFVLVNALYFKGEWNQKFDPQNTRPADFSVTDEKTVPVQMMFQKGQFKYAQAENYQVIALPYKDPNTSMVVVLPAEGVQLNPQEGFYREVSDRLPAATSVNVLLPKFTVRTRVALNKALETEGLGNLLNGKADYSKMTKEQIGALKVITEVVFKVDEKGSEGAAATAIEVERGVSQEPTFQADRPFFFAVVRKDKGRSTVLFQGEVTDPTK